MASPSPKIFISYRRDDAPGSTGRLYDRLAEAFSKQNVFIDVDAIVPGVDFVQALDDALRDCDVLLAIIGKNWLDSRDGDGRPRLESAEDFVRIEIATALGQGIRVVPVLVDGAKMPSATDLPDALQPLARRHAVELSHMRFAADTDRLTRALAQPTAETETAQGTFPEYAHPEPQGTARVTEAPATQMPDTFAQAADSHDHHPKGMAGPQTESAQHGRLDASIGVWLDSFFRRQSPMTIWGLPVAAGISLIWCSSFFGIDSIHAPPANTAESSFGPCTSVGKQVGLWTSLNWSAVYLVLFPIFLILISVLARYMRRMIDESVENGVLVRSDGGKPDPRAIHLELDRELAANNKLFITLIVVIAAISISGWWTSSGQPLLNFDLGDRVVSWGTVIIACGARDLQYHLFGYTLIAYIWMGLALFVFLACLFLGFIYASFVSRLAFSGRPSDGGGQTYHLIFRPNVFPRYLRDIFFTYFLACSFGLLAGYLMRLQAGYLFSGHESLGSYWFQDFHALMRNWTANAAADVAPQAYQLPSAKNQTAITGFFVAGITLVSFLGTGWMLYSAFQSAREFVLAERSKSQGSALRQIRDLTAEETREVESAGFLPAVIPAFVTMAAVVMAILLGTIYTGGGFVFLSVTIALLVMVSLQMRLRARRPSGGQGT